MYETLYLSLLC